MAPGLAGRAAASGPQRPTEQADQHKGHGAGADEQHSGGNDEYVLPPPPPVGQGEHALSSPYVLTFTHKPSGKAGVVTTAYESLIKVLGVFSSVEQFWRLYSCLQRPGDLPASCDYHLFRHGIRPMWEDPQNRTGGKWFVRLRKGVSNRIWENMVLALVGDQFGAAQDICGVVLSVRAYEDVLAVWTRAADDNPTNNTIREDMKRLLALPPATVLEYKAHSQSLQDKTSYRHTEVFV